MHEYLRLHPIPLYKFLILLADTVWGGYVWPFRQFTSHAEVQRAFQHLWAGSCDVFILFRTVSDHGGSNWAPLNAEIIEKGKKIERLMVIHINLFILWSFIFIGSTLNIMSIWLKWCQTNIFFINIFTCTTEQTPNTRNNGLIKFCPPFPHPQTTQF